MINMILLSLLPVMILDIAMVKGQIDGLQCDYGYLLSSFGVDKTINGFSLETELALAEALESYIPTKTEDSRSQFQHVISSSAPNSCFLRFCRSLQDSRDSCFNNFKERTSSIEKGSVTSFNYALYEAYRSHRFASRRRINVLHIILTSERTTHLEEGDMPFTPGQINCSQPTASVMYYINLFQSINIKLMILTTQDNVSFYEDLFQGHNNVRVVAISDPPPTEDTLVNEGLQNIANEQNINNVINVINELFCVVCDDFDNMDIVHIQDLSQSYKNDIEHLINVINMAYPRFSQLYTSRFALTGFTDKPLGLFGYSYDFCYREYLSFTPNVDNLLSTHSSLIHLSGRDVPESQLDAIRYSVNSQNLGWNRDSKTLRFVILATDAPMHMSGDYEGEINLLNPSGNFPCSISDYDSPLAINTLLTENETFLLVLASTGVYSYWQQIISTHFGLKGEVVEMITGQQVEDSFNVIQGIFNLISRICNFSELPFPSSGAV